jgi:hypothetical protein
LDRKPGNKLRKIFLDRCPVYPEKTGNKDKKAQPEHHRQGGFSGTSGLFPGSRTGPLFSAGFSYRHFPMIR